jgi:hypothetical protein
MSLIASRNDEVEGDYNSRVASTAPDELLLLGRSGIEVCDVLVAVTGLDGPGKTVISGLTL